MKKANLWLVAIAIILNSCDGPGADKVRQDIANQKRYTEMFQELKQCCQESFVNGDFSDEAIWKKYGDEGLSFYKKQKQFIDSSEKAFNEKSEKYQKQKDSLWEIKKNSMK